MQYKTIKNSLSWFDLNTQAKQCFMLASLLLNTAAGVVVIVAILQLLLLLVLLLLMLSLFIVNSLQVLNSNDFLSYPKTARVCTVCISCPVQWMTATTAGCSWCEIGAKCCFAVLCTRFCYKDNMFGILK